MDLCDERVARNDATFRDANERIFGSARKYDVTEAIPFLCECANPRCTAVIRLSAGQYLRIRGDRRRFFSVPGHADPFPGSLAVAEQHQTYDVIVQIGRVAEIAEELDRPPRP
jgi:hypothetical protein